MIWDKRKQCKRGEDGGERGLRREKREGR